MINTFRGVYSWLSNMSEVNVSLNGIQFKSVENAYIWAKCKCDERALDFCISNPPNICKKESKKWKIVDDWDNKKLLIMYNLLTQKYNKEPFKSKLISTGNQNIIEGNYWNDKFWGMCLKSNPNEGENWLGRLIMDIRNKILKKHG